MRILAPAWALLALLAAGCTSTDYLGVYKITDHHWIAEIMAAPDPLACTAPGYPVDDGDPYFALVNDAAHPSQVQYVRCSDPTECTTQPDYAWYSVSDDGGLNPYAHIDRPEFSPPSCVLGLGVFTVSNPTDTAIHLDMQAHRAFDDSIDDCTEQRALALASQPNCIYVERLDGERVQ